MGALRSGWCRPLPEPHKQEGEEVRSQAQDSSKSCCSAGSGVQARSARHTIMQRKVAFINTQGQGQAPANNRGNEDGGGRQGRVYQTDNGQGRRRRGPGGGA